ncbi:alpha/beta hydrolase [Streptoalloteichus hindustanus]|uniref:alpha/beta hydrolase n=1 Tax=Streptoalloteichus hindustanus TaxID=2017 RepID=UPI00135647D5|nr:alpha/beta hydrolase [Streptoalloteichus hindustanus]
MTEVVAAGSEVSWQPCGDGVLCGSLPVPADWSTPWRGERISLGLGKLPARHQPARQGTLLVNLGGPGPVVAYLPMIRDRLAALTEWFDVVVFDPRGIGASSGVTCPSRPPSPQLAAWPPRDAKAYNAMAEANRRYAADCEAAIGSLTGKLNSWQVAHDMDALRVALGERGLRYFGSSYGTVHGQAYARLFGRNVARMYLDSVLDHTERDRYDWLEPMAETLERRLHDFARWCGQTATCALHGQDALAVWDRVLAAAERAPIPAPGSGSAATVSIIVHRAGAWVESATRWPTLATALAEAAAGDASRFVPRGLEPDPADLSRFAFCADFPDGGDYAEVRRIEDRMRERVAPRLGWLRASVLVGQLFCGGLPRVGEYAPRRVRATGLPPVLLVSGRADTTTPLRHAERVGAQLPRSRVLPVDGSHALYVSGNACVRDHVHRYLTTGVLPLPGAHCPA